MVNEVCRNMIIQIDKTNTNRTIAYHFHSKNKQNFVGIKSYTLQKWGYKNHIKICLDILYAYKLNIYLNNVI